MIIQYFELRYERKRDLRKAISFTSVTTTVKECITALTYRNDEGDIPLFHKRIEALYDVNYAYSFMSGRMALFALLKAMRIGKGDEVILQGYTCCAVPKAVMYAGATPVYADISGFDYNMTIDSVQEKITENTKAIIVQHTYAIPCHDIFRIRELCDDKAIFLIEDCAHLIKESFRGQLLGTIGDAAFFSTDHTKYISTSVGGFAITSDDVIGTRLKRVYERTVAPDKQIMRAIKVQFALMNMERNAYLYRVIQANRFTRILNALFLITIKRFKLLFFMDDYSNTKKPDYAFPMKMSGLQARIGCMQLDRANSIIKRRRQLTAIYKRELRNIDLPPECMDYLRVPVVVNNKEKVIEALRDICVAEDWFTPVLECIDEDQLQDFHYRRGQCPRAEYISAHILNLPCHLKMTNKDARTICELFNQTGEGIRFHDSTDKTVY